MLTPDDLNKLQRVMFMSQVRHDESGHDARITSIGADEVYIVWAGGYNMAGKYTREAFMREFSPIALEGISVA